VCGFIANLPALWFLISRSRKHSASPHVNRHAGNYFESSSKGTQKLTSLPSAVIAKPQKLDPYDVEGDDCVPLRQRRSDHKGLGSNVSNQGSESGAEGGTEMGSTPGMACGWDDPTLETGYERTHSGKQNWERVRRPGP